MRVLGFAGVLVGTLVAFVFALLIGLALHLNTPCARRFVATEVSSALAQSFRGRIRIEDLGRLGFFGFVGGNAAIDDPMGRPVLVVRGARVHIATLATAWSAIFGKGKPLVIDLSDVSIDTLDVRLDTDAAGNLELVNALAPRTPTPSDPNARGIRLVMPRIGVAHAWAHGQVASAPFLDVDLGDLLGSFTYSPDVLEGDISKVSILARRIAADADLVGSLNAHAKKPSDPKATLGASVTWQGTFGGIAQTVRGSLVDGKLNAVVDVPEATPERVRALWPTSAFDKTASAHVEAHGVLPNVDVDIHAGLGEAMFFAKGSVAAGNEKTAKFILDGRDIDVREFAAAAPPSRIGLTGNGSATMKADGSLAGELAVRLLGGKLGATEIPGASVLATWSRSDSSDLRAHVDVVVDDAAAPTRITVNLFPRGAFSAVDFAMDARVPDFDRVSQLHHMLHGTCRISTTGSMDLGTLRLGANVDVEAARIAYGTTRAESASIRARVEGAITAPRIDVALRANIISAGGFQFTSADLRAIGAATAPHLTVSAHGPNGTDLDASADVAFGHGLSFAAVRASVARAGERAIVTADGLHIAGSDVRLDGARLEGLGAPASLTLVASPAALRVRASSHGIDLGRLGRLVHVEQNLKHGTLAFDMDVNLRRDGASGRGNVDLTQANIENVDDVSVHVQGELDGRKVVGKAHAQAGAIGFIDIAAPSLALGAAGPLSWAGWRQAWGDVAIRAHADLAKLAALARPEDSPLGEASGEVTMEAHVARDDIRDLTPDLTVSVTTNHLVIAPKTAMTRDIDGVWVMQRPPWRLFGVDFNMHANIDGDTGVLTLLTQIRDAKGELATLSASAAHFPYGDVLQDNGSLRADLRTMPFDLRIAVPERGLGTLPDLLKQRYVTGRLQGEATIAGTLIAPKAHLSAVLHQSRLAGTSRMPLELELAADYDGVHGKATLKARAEGRELLDAQAHGDYAIVEALDAGGAAAHWQASGHAHVARFPLEAIVFLDDKVISGLITGDISVVDLHKDAHADVTLSADSLFVGSVGYDSARLQAKTDGRVLDATVRIEQTDGFAEAKAHAATNWGEAFAPTLDPVLPLDVALSAKNFRIAGLLPFVDSWLDELDGRLDAETRVELDPRSRGARLSGGFALSRGAIEAVAGGGAFHDVAAKIDFSPDGLITLEKLTAAGVTGRMEATGSARLQGANLESARAVIIIPSDSAIPLSTGDAEIGDVDGRVEVSEATTGGGKGMEVNVEVPHLRVALPEVSTKSPQPLGDMGKLRIGVHRGHPATFVLVPLDPIKSDDASSGKPPARVVVHTHLGDVEVLRGKQLKVELTGRVDVNAGQTPPVSGQITLQKDGLLDVEGRSFRIVTGTVTFVGSDASNPEVMVTAAWTAPEGTVVYANFVGPLKTGKVTLTSEPPLPQQDIVELLRFGTTGGQQAAGAQSGQASDAIGVVGGQAAQPLNHALNQLGLGAVTAKIDTTESTAPKPEVEVQIAKDISIQIAVVLGTPPPGVNPDHTLLTLDWRFLTRWSLSSTLGDAGTSIFDVLWQRRY